MEPVTQIAFEDPFVHENRAYWTARSGSYSVQHRSELESRQHVRWQRELIAGLTAAIPRAGADPGSVSVLDAGCGPGFLSIVLAEAGFSVTAIDYTPAMLEQARVNAGPLAERITFVQMNAEELDFADESFDAVVSRNLTWDLPHPHLAYAEWCRVLRPGGLLMNFDADWYGYLFDSGDDEGSGDADESGRCGNGGNSRPSGRDATAIALAGSQMLHTDIDAMETIAREVPAGGLDRPAWDQRLLEELGMQVQVDEHAFERLWSDEEQASHAATPLFCVAARKADE